MRALTQSWPYIWALLFLPAIPLLWDFVADERYFAELMAESGILSIQLLILSLAITPIQRLTKNIPKLHPITRWLVKNRRYFGVASFGYAALHVAFYIRQTEALYDVAIESLELRYATGWIAVLIMALMAATSTNWAMRKLGARWKTLQRWVYLATLTTFAHWLLFTFTTSNLIFYAALTALIKLPQVRKSRP